jgi:hypothetical protein
MIGNTVKGSGIKGLLDYQEAKVAKGVGELLATNMAGTTVKELSHEFGLVRSLRPNLGKAVLHVSLSVDKEEILSNEQFVKIAEKYMDDMQYNNCQYLIYRHTDKEHPHIHLIINRVQFNGEVLSDKHDYKRSESAIRLIEKGYGLKQLLSSEKCENKSMSRGCIENFNQTGQVPKKAELQIIVTKALSNNPTVDKLLERLHSNGVSMHFHSNDNGVFGVSYSLDGISCKGSQLGKGYSWKSIINKISTDERIINESCRALYRRTQENSAGTNRPITSYQLAEYRATQASLGSYSRIAETTYSRNSRGGSQTERDTSAITNTTKQNRNNSEQGGTINNEIQGRTQIHTVESIPDSNCNWSNNEYSFLGRNLFLGLGSFVNRQPKDEVSNNDEDEETKKRKRKKKKNISQ